MTPDAFVTRVEHELQLLAVPFSRADLQDFLASVWPLAADDPCPVRWAREFLEATVATLTA